MFMPTVFGSNFMDDVFDDFFGSSFVPTTRTGATASMKADITETDKGYRIDMDLPGYAKDDVQAELKDGYMTITAEHNTQNEEKNTEGKVIRRERYSGSMQRSFYVGEDFTPQDIEAKFEDGILKIDLPKKEVKQIEAPKYIEIK